MVILLGLPPHGTVIDLAPDDLVNDDIVIQGSFGYTSQAFTEVVEQVNAGHLKPSFLITHRYALVSVKDQAIATLRGDVADDEPRGKVVIVADVARPRLYGSRLQAETSEIPESHHGGLASDGGECVDVIIVSNRRPRRPRCRSRTPSVESEVGAAHGAVSIDCGDVQSRDAGVRQR
jgi:hypothetical protein